MTTPYPLKILTTTELARSEELVADAAKGHQVTTDDTLTEYDVVLAPNAFRVHQGLLKYRELAYKTARAGKRGRKK